MKFEVLVIAGMEYGACEVHCDRRSIEQDLGGPCACDSEPAAVSSIPIVYTNFADIS